LFGVFPRRFGGVDDFEFQLRFFIYLCLKSWR